MFTTIFEVVAQILADILEWVTFTWDLFVYIINNFNATTIVSLGITAFAFILDALTQFMPPALETHVNTGISILDGTLFLDIMTLAFFVLDIFIPYEYLDASIAYILTYWAIVWIVRIIIKILGLFWPGAGSD